MNEDAVSANFRLQLALDAAGMLSWDWSPHADSVACSRDYGSFFGLAPSGQTIPNDDRFLAPLHPDDRTPYLTALRASFETGAPFHFEFRGLPLSGPTRWYSAQARMLEASGHDSRNGCAKRLVGVTQDITLRMQREERRCDSIEQNNDQFCESEARLQLLMDSLPVYISYIDADERYVWVNGLYENWYHRPRHEIIGRTVRELQGEALYRTMEPHMRAALSGQAVHYENCISGADGSPSTFEIQYIPHRANGGAIPGFFVLVFDISRERAAMRSLRESEERYRTLFETCGDAIFLLDTTGRILAANPAAVRMHGYSTDELLSMHISELDDPASARAIRDRIRRIINGETLNFEVEHRRKDGTTFPLEVVATRYRTGTETFILAFDRDITVRKESDRQFRLTQFSVDRSVDPVFWIAANAEILYVNDATCRMLGYTRDELIGRTIPEIDPNIDADTWPAHWNELRKRGSLTFESTHRTKSGEVLQIEVTANFVKFEGREFNCAMTRDITDRKQAERELRHSEARFSRLFYASPFSIMVATYPGGTIVDANAAFLRLFGFELSDVVGKSTTDLGIWDSMDDRAAMLDDLRKTGAARNKEFVFRAGCGKRVTLLLSVELIELNGQMHSLAMSIDITERKRAEALMRESLSRLQATLESTADSILVVDLEGRIVDCNRQFLELWGISQDMLATARQTDLIAELNGHASMQSILGHVTDPGQFVARVAEIYESPEATSFDVIEFRDGRVIERYSQPQRIEGVPIGRVWSFRDVTARRRAEQQASKLGEELTHLSRVSAVGELAAGIAHEVNQPLAAIHLNAEMARILARRNDAAGLDRVLEQIADQSFRAGEIIRRLRAFIRRESSGRKGAEVNLLVQEVLMLMADHLRQQMVMVETHFDAALPSIVVDGIQIQQVLVNLIRNACDAVAGNPSDTRQVAIRTELIDGELRVSISDNGHGLDPVIAERLFFPFLTTKSGGLGLGLSICRSIIEAHGGRITARSNPDRGTTFSFTLPVLR